MNRTATLDVATVLKMLARADDALDRLEARIGDWFDRSMAPHAADRRNGA